jgi:hypothetical protein
MKIAAVAALSALGLAVAGAQASPPEPSAPPAPPRALLASAPDTPETPELKRAREKMEAAVREYTEAYRKAHGDRGVWRFTTEDGDANVVILRRGERLNEAEAARVRALARRFAETRPYRFEFADGVRPRVESAREAREAAEAARSAAEAARSAAEAARREVDALRPMIEAMKQDAARLREQCLNGEIPCTIDRD